MTTWNTPTGDIINNQIWSDYLKNLMDTPAPETPPNPKHWPKEGLPISDYLMDPTYWGLQGEGPEWLADAETEDGSFDEVSLKHEEYRTYIYGDGVEFTISEPVWLITDHSAPEKHIVEDATAVYEVRPGWLAIKKGY